MSNRKTTSKLNAKNIVPDQILSEIRTALLNKSDFDKDVSKILAEYILIKNPKENAIENAVKAINRLIEDRAVAKLKSNTY